MRDLMWSICSMASFPMVDESQGMRLLSPAKSIRAIDRLFMRDDFMRGVSCAIASSISGR